MSSQFTRKQNEISETALQMELNIKESVEQKLPWFPREVKAASGKQHTCIIHGALWQGPHHSQAWLEEEKLPGIR